MPKYARLNTPIVASLLALLVSLWITFQVFHMTQIEVEKKMHDYFDFHVRETIAIIDAGMQTYAQVLRGAAGLYEASNYVKRDEFKRYVTRLDLANNYPGVQAVGLILVVPAAQKNHHIESVRSEGFPEYTIQPAGQRDIYTSVIYIEPFSDRNSRALGHDPFTDPVRHAAMQAAVDSGQATLSEKVKLIQETGTHDQAGVLMYLPLYRNGSKNDTLTDRRQNIVGWVFFAFRMHDLMHGLYGEHAAELALQIFDGEGTSPASLMYESHDVVLAKTKFNVTRRIQIADHFWTVNLRALPLISSRVDASRPRLVAIVGIAGSILISLLVWMLMSGRERAVNAARRMNLELIAERQRLSSIIEGTHVGTWEWNVQTGETIFNNYWANIIGYELSELDPISIETWLKFVHPDDAKLSGELLEKHFSGELDYYECEARMRHKDGRWIWVLDRGKVTTWAPDGKPLTMSGTHQEISVRKQIEQNLRESEARFRFMLESSPIAVIITNMSTGLVKFANQAYAKLINVTLDTVTGVNSKQYYANQQDYVDVMDMLNKGQSVTNKLIETLGLGEQAKTKWSLASYRLITLDNEPAVLGWFYDVTDSTQADFALQKSRAELSALVNAIPDPVWLKDAAGVFKYCNPAVERLCGAKETDIVGKTDYDFVDKAQADFFRENDSKAMAANKPSVNEEWLTFADGGYCGLFETTKIAVHMNDGSVIGVLGIARDITERKRAENSLRITATVFDSQEGMMVTDANNKILRVNSAFTAITGYTSEDVIGQTPRLLSSGRQDKAFYAAMWESLNQTGLWAGEVWNRRKGGEDYPEHLTITAVKDAIGIVTNYVATLTDITMSKAASDEIKNLAFYDPLTRLPNRRLLLDRLNQALVASARSGQRGAVLFLDLDHFKTLNDTLGHDVGDLLLQQVASRLTSCVREGDTVARLGGDEFVVLLEGLSEQATEAAAQTEAIGQKILTSLNQLYQLGEHEYHSTPSLGATLFHDHEAGLEAILKQADVAMYQSKSEGRNTFRFFAPKVQVA